MTAVSVDGGVERPVGTPQLPRSIWVIAWASLAVQVLLVVRHGGRVGDEASQVVSVVLGGLLVGYVSAGVVRARRVRIVVAWVVLTLGVVGGIADLVWGDDVGQTGLDVLALTGTVVSLVALARFSTSDWYAWQRTRPPARDGASIGQLVVMGVLVGALGGYVGIVDGGLTTQVNVDVG